MEVGGRLVRHSAPYRYVWPSELDLMARLAGFRLEDRWADWHRSPFTADSTGHVTVYQKRAAVTGPGANFRPSARPGTGRSLGSSGAGGHVPGALPLW